jgi:Holliday junction resolvasome RuvABC endonuclease subunit
MFVLESEAPVERILSIDPGTNTLGVAILRIQGPNTALEYAFTLQVGKLYTRYPLIIENHGDKVAKLYTVQQDLLKLMEAWKPTYLVSEGPFMGSFPAAYAALVECLDAIRRAVLKYDETLPLTVISPSIVKKSIGVSGKSGDKTLVRAALSTKEAFTIMTDISLNNLDEHAIDAIAVGLAFRKLHGI